MFNPISLCYATAPTASLIRDGNFEVLTQAGGDERPLWKSLIANRYKRLL